MQPARSISTPPAPSRPAATLSPLAEAIIAAVGEHYRTVGGNRTHHFEAKGRMLAAFADIGISPDTLKGLARVITS